MEPGPHQAPLVRGGKQVLRVAADEVWVEGVMTDSFREVELDQGTRT